MSGPYFAGQQHQNVGTYYPDVIRPRDEKRQDGKYFRVMDYTYCGRYEIELYVQNISVEILRKLNKRGHDAGTREDEVTKVRKRLLKEFLSK